MTDPGISWDSWNSGSPEKERAVHNTFTVVIASDPDHEKVYAEIYCNDRFVALVSQEHGPHVKVLELPGPGLDEQLVSRKVDLVGFQQALEQAARMLR